jgi:hypothetical protein
MLNLREVDNIDIHELKQVSFDIAIFASGYESRSIFLAQNLQLKNFSKNNISHWLFFLQ